MALMPKRVKHRKQQRGHAKGKATRGNVVSFGEYGLQSLEGGWVSAKQIEAGRLASQHFLKGQGRLFIRMFPDKPVTSIPLETRMGKGKGEPEFYAAVVRPGKILYEIGGVSEMLARQALARVARKLSVKVKFVARRQVV
ncbi:MAG TPA: 50S ribosomal protein L16 [Planctomycetota bacterium]|jgi:large subunit ribosomal protein L16|nr:50S ribosomal protein L16 [Planctomycetota bacterium]OQC19584.1 MAG: 50S ribosomal protein L16 [Planctomycetes bacterium ADurb.Bin069]NMD36615.1 50S ribosomal protein L16 [Planctomycetota bacterium]HNR98995.1 50S ribosomal protein L16 [Planctomycetota bacterium]HNU27006.1 50S ribosomal protein L16 [Planctomycetota bacterium]